MSSRTRRMREERKSIVVGGTTKPTIVILPPKQTTVPQPTQQKRKELKAIRTSQASLSTNINLLQKKAEALKKANGVKTTRESRTRIKEINSYNEMVDRATKQASAIKIRLQNEKLANLKKVADIKADKALYSKESYDRFLSDHAQQSENYDKSIGKLDAVTEKLRRNKESNLKSIINIKDWTGKRAERSRDVQLQRVRPKKTITKKWGFYVTDSKTGEKVRLVYDTEEEARREHDLYAVGTLPTPPHRAGAGIRGDATRNFLGEIVTDMDNFLQEIRESPGSYIRDIPQKIIDTRKDLGAFLDDLSALSRQFRWKGNAPTKSEIRQYFRDNPDASLRHGGPNSPFQAKNADEFFNRVAGIITRGGITYTKAMTFPLSWGLAPTKREYSEELPTEILVSLLTISPFDVAAGKFVGKFADVVGDSRLAVYTMSKLQRMGKMGQDLLRKIIGGKSLTKTEAKLWESMTGKSGVSTTSLRDTSKRLFLRKGVHADDVGDISKWIDDAFVDTTGVVDWTKIDKFIDTQKTPVSTQYAVVDLVKEQLADMRSKLGKLMDTDPVTGEMTTWGLFSEKGKIKFSKAYKDYLKAYQENMESFGAGALKRPDALMEAENIMREAGIDINDLFEGADDYINFLTNNPSLKTAADIIMLLNNPVEGATPTSRFLRETKTEWDVDTYSDMTEKLADEELERFKSTPIFFGDIDDPTKLEEEEKLTPPGFVSWDPNRPPEEITKLDPIIDITYDPIEDPDFEPLEPPGPVPPEPIPILEPTLKDLEARQLREGRQQDAPGRSQFISVRGKKIPIRPRKSSMKLPPSVKPEPYEVKFQYNSGASETKRVDARTYQQAHNTANRQRRIKDEPIQVDVEKL